MTWLYLLGLMLAGVAGMLAGACLVLAFVQAELRFVSDQTLQIKALLDPNRPAGSIDQPFTDLYEEHTKGDDDT